MKVYLECRVSKTEPDFETPALERGVTLSACAARGTTHLAVSEGYAPVQEIITESPKLVRIPIEAHQDEHSTEVVILKSTRLNASVDRLAASVMGVVTKSLAGQASVPLHEIFSGSVTLAPVQFGGWRDISAALAFTDPKITTLDGSRLSVIFKDPPESVHTHKVVTDELTKIYEEAWTHAQAGMRFDQAPSLHKCIMADPVGMVGCRYNLATATVDKACALSNQALEDALAAAVRSELQDNKIDMEGLRVARGLEAAKWAGVVMTSLSSVASWLIPYKADTLSCIKPNGSVGATDAEFWMEEPIRLGMGDDCEGAASFCTSCVYQFERMFADPSAQEALSKTYPTCFSAYKALSYYKVGVAVIAANAGHVGGAGGDAIAGHAMVIGVPVVHLLDALIAGGEEQHLQSAQRAHMFAHASVPGRVSPQELSLALCGGLDDRIRDLPGLACEGTGPSESQLWERDPQVRANMKAVASRLDTLLESVSPSIGMPIRSLNTGPGGSHSFYKYFVEFLLPTSTACNNELNKYGAAACHFALGTSKTKAGVNPTDLAEGRYTAAARWKCTEERAKIIGAASLEARAHTLPPSGPIQLTQTQNDILSQNMQLLSELNNKMAQNVIASEKLSAGDFDEVRVLVPFAAQIGNRLGVANMVKLMENHPGRVQTSPVTGVAEFGGEQKGVFSVITLMGMK